MSHTTPWSAVWTLYHYHISCNVDVDNEDTSKSNKDGSTDPTVNQYGDSPTQGSIRSQVFKSSVAQSKQINNQHNRLSKDVLSVGDICNVEIEGKIRGAEGPKYLPVAVMEVSNSQRGNISYRVT